MYYLEFVIKIVQPSEFVIKIVQPSMPRAHSFTMGNQNTCLSYMIASISSLSSPTLDMCKDNRVLRPQFPSIHHLLTNHIFVD